MKDLGAPIVVTSGEPAGIGPDVCLALAARAGAARVVVLGDREVLQQRARALGIASLPEIVHVPAAADWM